MSQFDPFVRYYDHDYGQFEDDLLFYEQLARRTGGPILELMCGTGRVALPLARAGYQVTGVDSAPAMLEQARRKAASARLSSRVELVQADVRQLALGRSYALAIVAINSLMHLESSADQLAALEAIAAHLSPGGLLAIDLFNPLAEAPGEHDGVMLLDKVFTLPESGHSVQKFVIRQSNAAEQTNAVTFCYDEVDREGVVRRLLLPFTMRWLYRYEAEHLLARAGLRLEAVYGSYDLDEYDSAAERMLLIAVRS